MIAQAVALYPYSPYCGAPPVPAALAGRWNLDPILLTVLALCLAACCISRRWRLLPLWRRLAVLGGWAIGSLALISPLCALSVALFSGRASQHMILSSLAAPLVALGVPARPAKVRASIDTSSGRPLMSALAFAVALWFWHAPGPYETTFRGDLAYWLMHISIFGSALWLWSELFAERASLAGVAGAAALTTAQMAVLGAAITFASHPLYAPHLSTTAAWGLTPLEDQQLGGVIMWAPAGLVFAAGLLLVFAQTLRRGQTRALHRTVAG